METINSQRVSNLSRHIDTEKHLRSKSMTVKRKELENLE
jgi:hypothetical protein